MAEEEQKPDDRPQPKYGELAPPGWVWRPPRDTNRLDTARHSPAASAPTDAPSSDWSKLEPLSSEAPSSAPSGPALSRPGAPRWNVMLTIMLLVLGFFGMSYSIGTLQALPAAMQLLHSMQHLGAYTPAESVGALITAGTIAMAGIWAVSAGLSVWLLVQRRLAFYVPLVAGVVAVIALLVVVGVVLSTDPTLLDYYGGVTPTPTDPPSTTLSA